MRGWTFNFRLLVVALWLARALWEKLNDHLILVERYTFVHKSGKIGRKSKQSFYYKEPEYRAKIGSCSYTLVFDNRRDVLHFGDCEMSIQMTLNISLHVMNERVVKLTWQVTEKGY